jgi:hypothetical protein
MQPSVGPVSRSRSRRRRRFRRQDFVCSTTAAPRGWQGGGAMDMALRRGDAETLGGGGGIKELSAVTGGGRVDGAMTMGSYGRCLRPRSGCALGRCTMVRRTACGRGDGIGRETNGTSGGDDNVASYTSETRLSMRACRQCGPSESRGSVGTLPRAIVLPAASECSDAGDGGEAGGVVQPLCRPRLTTVRPLLPLRVRRWRRAAERRRG